MDRIAVCESLPRAVWDARRWLWFVVAVVLAGAAPAGTAAAKTDGYRQLTLEGALVKWRQGARDLPVRLTYALATAPSFDEEAINCRRIGPIDELLRHSTIAEADFRDALGRALRRWELAANLVFVETADQDAANIVIGRQLEPRGIAFANLTLSEETVGPYRLIERSRVCLNATRKWKIGFNGNLDVYDLVHTLTHEVGHAIGLDHPRGRNHVMSFQYRETRDGLSPGDILGVQRIYGRPVEHGIRRWSADFRLGSVR